MFITIKDILERLFDIKINFPNDEEIQELSNNVINQISKIPTQYDKLKIMNKVNVKNFNEKIKNLDINNLKSILSDLEKINAGTANINHLEDLKTEDFKQNLQIIFEECINDPETNDLNEKLLNNIIALTNKLELEGDNILQVKKLKQIMTQKTFYRDIYYNCSKSLSKILSKRNYSSNLELNKEILKELDENFVEKIFETMENYVDDHEVSKELNNILCNLCLKSKKLSAFIVRKGGLKNIMYDLKSIISDEALLKEKNQALKFLSSLIKDKDTMDEFVLNNGVDLVNNVLRQQIKYLDDKAKENNNEYNNLYQLDSGFDYIESEKDSFNKVDEDSNNIKEGVDCCFQCLEIMDEGLIQGNNEFLSDKTVKGLIKSAE